MPDFRILRSFAALTPALDDVRTIFSTAVGRRPGMPTLGMTAEVSLHPEHGRLATPNEYHCDTLCSTHRHMFDKFKDECGVFGILNHRDAANLTYLGLYALQHRGQESAGIASVSYDPKHSETNSGEVCGSTGAGEQIITPGTAQIHSEKEMGYVADIFSQERLARLPGDTAIGHVRYSTAGGSMLCNAQPLVASTNKGPIALAHNGNLVNGSDLRHQLEADGAIFNSTSDSEVIVHLIARSRQPTLEKAFVDALSQCRGAYSLALLAPGRIYVARDPYGFRPLVLGRLEDALVVSSETCAFDLIGADMVREVVAGEVVAIEKGGFRVVHQFPSEREARCIFEHVYFARPDSSIFGNNVAEVRRRFGAQLAREHPQDADIVIPVPDSGVFAALGYAHESGIPFQFGLVRNHYVGRTFIEPKQSIRHFGVKVKLNPVRELVAGKKIILVDDSIVRGTTSKKIVRMLKQYGAKEVHMRISSPPTTGPCYYGIDTPQRRDLIASANSTENIREFIEADSLGYLSEEGMLEAVRNGDDPKRLYCTACFTGRYPLANSATACEPETVKAT
jgi:amidophosphoribosyltransferase